MMKHSFIVSLFFLALLSISGLTYAQEIPTARVELTATPEIPEPGETVTLRFATYGSTINPSTIVWLENGIVFEQKTDTAQVTAGPIGSAQVIRVTAQDTSGTPISTQITLQPSAISLFVEGTGYTPSFYKGRSAPIKEGSFWVYAIPEVVTSSGTMVQSNNLIFTWYRNNQRISDQSGLGKNSFFVEGSILSKNQEIRVAVNLANKSTPLASKTLDVSLEEPLVRLYEDNSLYGILFNKSFSDQENLSQTEITLEAVPFFFSNPGSLIYNWRKDNQKLFQEDTNTNNITLRNQDGGSGRNSISLRVANQETFSQEAFTSLLLNF